jgi:hypothetical protein
LRPGSASLGPRPPPAAHHQPQTPKAASVPPRWPRRRLQEDNDTVVPLLPSPESYNSNNLSEFILYNNISTPTTTTL